MGSDASIRSEDLTPSEQIEALARQTRQAYPPVPQSPADDSRVAQLEAKVLGLSTSLAELLEERAEEAFAGAEGGIEQGPLLLQSPIHEYETQADGQTALGRVIGRPELLTHSRSALPYIAYEDWTNPARSDRTNTDVPYVKCHGCDSLTGGNEDAVTHTIYLPRTAHRLNSGMERMEPNVVDNDVIMAVRYGSILVCVSPYLDGWFGEVVMNIARDGSNDPYNPPPGWRLMEGSPHSLDTQSKFPIGHNTAIAAYDKIIESGGTFTIDTPQHTHAIGHTVLGNVNVTGAAAAVQDPSVVEGTPWLTDQNSSSDGAGTIQPPYFVVRFVERYDNSKV